MSHLHQSQDVVLPCGCEEVVSIESRACCACCVCSANATRQDFAPVAQFKGFAHVKKRDELSLMYAVWRHGPVAISLDASQPSFKFYSEGVYKEKKCLTKKVS